MTLADLLNSGRVDVESCPSHLHAGQREIWESKATDIVACAGAQGGKTSLNAWWLEREIQRCKPLIKELGRGDFLYVGPNLKLLGKQAIPQLKEHFESFRKYGTLKGEEQSPKFVFSSEGAQKLVGMDVPIIVHFAYASDSSNLESLTALGGIWDEAGQPENKEASLEAFNRRLTIARGKGFGRRLFTTTPYDWGWFKHRIVDLARSGYDGFSYHNWASWVNPINSEEVIRGYLEQGMPEWSWRMMYLGEWTRPEGAVYPCFDSRLENEETGPTNVVAKVSVTDEWRWWVGVDFGTRNTALSLIVEDTTVSPTVFYKVREYHAGADEVDAHVRAMKAMLPKGVEISGAYGGAKSEEAWRLKFHKAGLQVREPKFGGPNTLDAGLQSVYELIHQRRFKVLASCKRTVGQYEDYSYDRDSDGRITDRIKDKERYHFLDSDRYLLSTVCPGTKQGLKSVASRF